MIYLVVNNTTAFIFVGEKSMCVCVCVCVCVHVCVCRWVGW